MSCHLLHRSVTETEAKHTLLEGVAAICPKWENPGLCAPRTLGLHPRPLVFFLPCSAPFVPSHLLLGALSAFFPCFQILGLSSFFFKLPFMNPFYLSHVLPVKFPSLNFFLLLVSISLPAGAMSLCVVFFIVWLPSLLFHSLLLLARSFALLFRWSQTYRRGLFPVFLFDWLFVSLHRSQAQPSRTPSPNAPVTKFPGSSPTSPRCHLVCCGFSLGSFFLLFCQDQQ